MDQRGNPTRFRLGHLEIDLVRSSVRGQASASDLTPRAEALLLLLARNANEVVAPEQILQVVWAGRVVEEAVISNCVWQIRKALGPLGKDILQNRTKRGYMLVVPAGDWIPDAPLEEPGGTESIAVPSSDIAASDRPLAGLSGGRSEDSATHSTRTVTGSLASPLSASETHSGHSVLQPAEAADATGSGAKEHDAQASDGTSMPFFDALTGRPRRVLIAALSICCIVALIGFRTWVHAPAPGSDSVSLTPDAEMTVMIEVPDKASWLRHALLMLAVEQAHLRGAEVLALERRQKRNPFSGPHFEVRSLKFDGGDVDAEFLLRQGSFEERLRFRGPARGLVDAARVFLRDHLPEPTRARSDAVDILVSARTAYLMRDRQTALLEYRRALARDPALVEATLAMAGTLTELGRTQEALAALKKLDGGEGITESQRCQRNVMLADIDPEALRDDVCEQAARVLWTAERRAKSLLRALEANREQRGGAGQWLSDELNAIQALIDLREFEQARHRIAESELIASDAGWESGRAGIAAFKSRFALEDGRIDESLELLQASLRAHENLGDTDSVIAFRTLLLKRSPLIPGPTIEENRAEIREVIEMARNSGSVRGEVDALHALMRLDRDHPERWRSHLERMEQLTSQAYAPRKAAEEKAYTLQELLTQRMYGEAIAEADRMRTSGQTFSQVQLWNMTTLAEAHFFRDELPEALATIESMHKENFDISYTSPCVFAWLSVEADRPDLHAMMANKCPHREYDPNAKATRGVYSILADARAYVRQGEPRHAWPELQPHIDEALELPTPTRQQVQALTLLSTYAVALPGSDATKLHRALHMGESLEGLDGAGPLLRFNVHTLRWRLCMADGRADCGPALPAWAQEDRLAARLAAEYAASLRAPR